MIFARKLVARWWVDRAREISSPIKNSELATKGLNINGRNFSHETSKKTFKEMEI